MDYRDNKAQNNDHKQESFLNKTQKTNLNVKNTFVNANELIDLEMRINGGIPLENNLPSELLSQNLNSEIKLDDVSNNYSLMDKLANIEKNVEKALMLKNYHKNAKLKNFNDGMKELQKKLSYLSDEIRFIEFNTSGKTEKSDDMAIRLSKGFSYNGVPSINKNRNTLNDNSHSLKVLGNGILICEYCGKKFN
ncbi:hypothetical protein [Spiroplasma endosymbiont of Labia minor]|uniref:hypothetical protein n=1 Tax=Spiroplasma endosymbiont of Labia minor TaxID=3066305 RepID=UPI0030D113A6